jgi:hypothetical protein
METIQIGPMVRTLFNQNRPMAIFLTGILAILIVLVVLIILQITGLISLRLDKDQMRSIRRMSSARTIMVL